MYAFAVANWGWFVVTTASLGFLAFVLGSNLFRPLHMHQNEATVAMLLTYPVLLLFALSLIPTVFMVIVGIKPN